MQCGIGLFSKLAWTLTDLLYSLHIQKFSKVCISKIEVRCGEWDLIYTDELGIHQDRKIKEVTIHPLYTGTAQTDFSDIINYNFALLHLEKDFDFNDHISHVCLPKFPDLKTGSNFYKVAYFLCFIKCLNITQS